MSVVPRGVIPRVPLVARIPCGSAAGDHDVTVQRETRPCYRAAPPLLQLRHRVPHQLPARARCLVPIASLPPDTPPTLQIAHEPGITPLFTVTIARPDLHESVAGMQSLDLDEELSEEDDDIVFI